jgi:hypothetical protein
VGGRPADYRSKLTNVIQAARIRSLGQTGECKRDDRCANKYRHSEQERCELLMLGHEAMRMGRHTFLSWVGGTHRLLLDLLAGRTLHQSPAALL